MIRLTMSYRGAMASNISRTAVAFSEPVGRVAESQLRRAGSLTLARLRWARFVISRKGAPHWSHD